MTTFLLHILSTLDFYFLISNLNKKFLRFSIMNYKIVALTLILFSSLAFLFQPFQESIYMQKVNFTDSGTTETLYQSELYFMADTNFKKTQFKKIYEIFWFSFRDGVLLFILIVLNILIYIQVIKSIKNKKKMLKTSKTTGLISMDKDRNNSIESEDSRNANESRKRDTKKKNKEDRAVQKLTIMVVLGCINTIINRILILLFFIMINTIGYTGPVPTINTVACFVVYITYSLYFFLYLFSNKRFQKVFFEGCHKMLAIIKC